MLPYQSLHDDVGVVLYTLKKVSTKFGKENVLDAFRAHFPSHISAKSLVECCSLVSQYLPSLQSNSYNTVKINSEYQDLLGYTHNVQSNVKNFVFREKGPCLLKKFGISCFLIAFCLLKWDVDFVVETSFAEAATEEEKNKMLDSLRLRDTAWLSRALSKETDVFQKKYRRASTSTYEWVWPSIFTWAIERFVKFPEKDAEEAEEEQDRVEGSNAFNHMFDLVQADISELFPNADHGEDPIILSGIMNGEDYASELRKAWNKLEDHTSDSFDASFKERSDFWAQKFARAIRTAAESGCGGFAVKLEGPNGSAKTTASIETEANYIPALSFLLRFMTYKKHVTLPSSSEGAVAADVDVFKCIMYALLEMAVEDPPLGLFAKELMRLSAIRGKTEGGGYDVKGVSSWGQAAAQYSYWVKQAIRAYQYNAERNSWECDRGNILTDEAFNSLMCAQIRGHGMAEIWNCLAYAKKWISLEPAALETIPDADNCATRYGAMIGSSHISSDHVSALMDSGLQKVEQLYLDAFNPSAFPTLSKFQFANFIRGQIYLEVTDAKEFDEARFSYTAEVDNKMSLVTQKTLNQAIEVDIQRMTKREAGIFNSKIAEALRISLWLTGMCSPTRQEELSRVRRKNTR